MSEFSNVFELCAKWVLENSEGATSNHYLLDTTQGECRRGFTYGGIHLWEHVPSQNVDHLVKGLSPVTCTGMRDGLYVGQQTLPYDELKGATLAPDKLMTHWKLASVDNSKLIGVNWKHTVLVLRDKGHAQLLIHDFPPWKPILLGEHIPECDGFITAFHIGALMPALLPYVELANSINLSWISESQSVLAFDTDTIGGVISCWYPDGKAENPKEEDIKVKIGGELFTYHRINNILTKKGGKQMNIKIPTNPAAKKAEVEEVKNPVEIETTAVEETSQEPAQEAMPPEPAEEPTIEQQLEAAFNRAETIKTLVTELVKELKPLMKAVGKMKKEAGNSTEVKELRAENKELQAKNKALEKEVAAKNQALKLLTSNL